MRTRGWRLRDYARISNCSYSATEKVHSCDCGNALAAEIGKRVRVCVWHAPNLGAVPSQRGGGTPRPWSCTFSSPASASHPDTYSSPRPSTCVR
eukprot:2968103-Prymnesium_polylepis.1